MTQTILQPKLTLKGDKMPTTSLDEIIFNVIIKDPRKLFGYAIQHLDNTDTFQVCDTCFNEYFILEGVSSDKTQDIKTYTTNIAASQSIKWQITSNDSTFTITSIYVTIEDDKAEDVGRILFPNFGNEINGCRQFIGEGNAVSVIAGNFPDNSPIINKVFRYTVKFMLHSSNVIGNKTDCRIKFDPTIQPHVNTK